MSRKLPPPKAAISPLSLRQLMDEHEGVSVIALDEIEVIPGFNPRSVIESESPFTPQALDDLTESIRSNGLLQPLLLRPGPTGKYILVAGERRLHASRLAGLVAVPALVRDMNPEEADEFALQENLQRSDLSNDAKALLAIRAVARHMNVPEEQTVLVAGRIKKTGLDPEGLGDMLRRSFGISVSTFAQRYGKFLQLNPAERQVLLEGRYGISALAPLAQLPDTEERRQLLDRLVTGQLSAAELHLEVTRLKRGAVPDRTLDQRLKSALPQLRRLSGKRRLQAERLIDQLLELTEESSSHDGNR